MWVAQDIAVRNIQDTAHENLMSLVPTRHVEKIDSYCRNTAAKRKDKADVHASERLD